MDIQIKPMKLIFTRTETHWNKQIVELANPDNVFLDITYQIFDEPTSEEFDEWEKQIKALRHFNIVEVERFI